VGDVVSWRRVIEEYNRAHAARNAEFRALSEEWWREHRQRRADLEAEVERFARDHRVTVSEAAMTLLLAERERAENPPPDTGGKRGRPARWSLGEPPATRGKRGRPVKWSLGEMHDLVERVWSHKSYPRLGHERTCSLMSGGGDLARRYREAITAAENGTNYPVAVLMSIVEYRMERLRLDPADRAALRQAQHDVVTGKHRQEIARGLFDEPSPLDEEPPWEAL
jgi:hypothetical protein